MAKQFPDQLSFAVSDKSDMSFELQALGLADDRDVVAGLYDAKGRKYAMDGAFSVDALKKFAQQFLDGELDPYVKSEPVPEDNSGPVKVGVTYGTLTPFKRGWGEGEKKRDFVLV